MCTAGGREPPDTMSFRYADTSLPDLLGRPNLHYADQAYAMQTMSPLSSKRASTSVKRILQKRIKLFID